MIAGSDGLLFAFGQQICDRIRTTKEDAANCWLSPGRIAAHRKKAVRPEWCRLRAQRFAYTRLTMTRLLARSTFRLILLIALVSLTLGSSFVASIKAQAHAP
jgi:hypothetical protein